MTASTGYKLKMKRMSIGLSQDEFAKKVGFSKKTVSLAERNKLSDKAESVIKMLEYYEKNG